MIRYKILIFITMIFVTDFLQAGILYPVNSIPEVLKKNAEAIIREDTYIFEISSISSAKLSRKFVVTILNENSIRLSRKYLFYDKFTKVKNISCVVYNQNGEKVKSLGNDKILDVSAIAGYSLFDDSRLKIVDPEYALFPFTVIFEWDEVYDGTLSYPSWKPYHEYSVSVQLSDFSIIVNAGLKDLRYLELNNAPSCEKTSSSKSVIYHWKLTDLPAIKYEPFSQGLDQYTPVVYVAPSDFDMDGYQGNLESWENFGKWNADLIAGRTVLPDVTKTKIVDLVKDASTEKEKINRIYKYMQQKVRYVNLSLGIGGWQPIEAQQTDKVSYGDCKGLSNYMKALLEAAGIKSNYTIAMAGSGKSNILPQFPSNQFNHVILCVPIPNDTVWLECTSQRNPVGYLGTFTDDRDVLLIDENGGKLIHTPVYSMKDNTSNTHIDVELDANGDISASVNASNKGLFYAELEQVLGMDEHDRKEYLMKSISLSGFEVPVYSYTQVPDQPVMNQTMELYVRKYANMVNKQIILRPNILTRVTESPNAVTNRKSKVVLRREWQENDTITYSLPETASIGSLPNNIDIESEFGHYKASFVNENGKLIYTRQFTRNKGTFEPEKYEDLISFYEKIRKADDTKLKIII